MHQLNRAHTGTANAFAPPLPLSRAAGTAVFGGDSHVPAGCALQPDGSVLLQLHAPGARTVALLTMDGPQTFVPAEDGLWRLTLPPGEGGFRPLLLQVDGVPVLSGMLPIGFGSSRAINFLDLPRIGAAGEWEACEAVPHGAVTQEIYWSRTTDNWETCLVYTPPGYQQSQRDYPVVYLQHGHGENERCWVYQGRINFILDNLLARGRAEPCLVVMNNGMVPSTVDGDWAARPQLLEPLLLQDCIPYIEQTYRCRTDAQSRAIAGLSMGSMQASCISLRHPEMFAWVGIFSGFVRKLPQIDPTPDDHLAALADPAAVRGAYRLFYRAIGEQDPFLPRFEEESALLAAHGLSPIQWPAHRERRFAGSHEWNVWRDCAKAFFQLVFQPGQPGD